jgi:hypothetical protein
MIFHFQVVLKLGHFQKHQRLKASTHLKSRCAIFRFISEFIIDLAVDTYSLGPATTT